MFFQSVYSINFVYSKMSYTSEESQAAAVGLETLPLEKLSADEARQWRGFKSDHRGDFDGDPNDETVVNDSMVVGAGDETLCDLASMDTSMSRNLDEGILRNPKLLTRYLRLDPDPKSWF